LAPKRHPGPPGKLDAAQRRRLGAALLEGSKAQGFATDLWTGPRVAQLVRRMFGVRYNPKYVPRLLRSLGWTPQRPEGRAYERDEKAIARWVRDEWPRIKKRQSARRAPRVPG
jgi:transposase